MLSTSPNSPAIDPPTELAVLKGQLEQLEQVKAAYQAHQELLTSSMFLVRTATHNMLLKATLQKILQVANQLAKAETGSLFLLDKSGVFLESILARGAMVQEMKQSLIGKVLDQGLAGWVYRNHKIGLVEDALHDERWLKLPGQPYDVRSALALPLRQGKYIIGIITLMHSEPNYFDEKSVSLLKMNLETIALIIENAQIHVRRMQ
jgi:GAF domain-containing protein